MKVFTSSIVSIFVEEAKLKQVQKQLDMVEKEAEKLESTLEEESVPSEETTVKHRKGKKH